ncbi:MAG: SipW-dependent-type signal peptide-containing protein [Firmicutes bacterium]|nr:SipW-dependent-type signal peptide-containing protein [Bacillota bacterium]
MTNKRKALMTVLAAMLLVTMSVFGTLAYLTSTDAVTNTFTVGNVAITLDEADVDNSKTNVTTEGRDKANAYHLLPGHVFAKDPTVHVEANSENSWVFVKVENGIADYEAVTDKGNIAAQISANGWTPLDGVDGVYYKEYTKQATVKDYVVFEKFKIDDNAQAVEGWSDIASKTIKVTAYAVQKDDVVDIAAEAWNIVKDKA